MIGEVGCYVYKVVDSIGIGIRRAPSTGDEYKTGRSAEPGDLISIDLVIDPEEEKGNGPFLRLSDGSGWLFEKKDGDVLMEPVPVEKGLWSFYVDNFPVGIGLRNHPIDQLQKKGQDLDLKQVPEKVLPPMRKVFCDRTVKGRKGVDFYRVQGKGLTSWIFDKRNIEDEEDPDIMLLPERSVQTGLFAFKALDNIGIRSGPNVGDETRTDWSVSTGDFVVCDYICESPFKHGNGPFLRLVDGSGWLFVNKRGAKLMEKIPLEHGKWKLKVKNDVGISLRKQPIDATKSRFSKIYAKSETVNCDKRIQTKGPSEVKISFYRVQGTNGWVFDRRDDYPMMDLISGGPKANDEDVAAGWTVEFVRSEARSVPGMKEIDFNPQSKVISFRHPEGARINVYYTTRTIGTALDHPYQGRTQLFRRECTALELAEIFKTPRVHTGHGYFRATKRQKTDHLNSQDVDVEGDFRNRLVDLDAQRNSLLDQKQALWKTIHAREEHRIQQEAKMLKLQKNHTKLLENEGRTCKHCQRELGSKSALQNHIQDVHQTFECYVCDRSFKGRKAYNQHKRSSGH